VIALFPTPWLPLWITQANQSFAGWFRLGFMTGDVRCSSLPRPNEIESPGLEKTRFKATPSHMPDSRKVVRRISSTAPTRICDNGGWTDTWFARRGVIFNIAVTPAVEVQLSVYDHNSSSAPFTINAQNYSERYSFEQPNGTYGRHPLIEAAFDCVPLPKGQALELSVFSEAPAGCSTGTSASVTVAVIGALDCLTPGRLMPYEVAAIAHKVETEMLHQQCGIQDQIAAAFGGINFIEMDRYPRASVTRIVLPGPVEHELEARLALIYVGHGHSSPHIHEMVIRELQDAGPDAAKLERLRSTAAKSRDALCACDFVAFGRAMIENTEAQRNLHPQLVGASHQEIIDIAKEHGALGWKVNGAGGAGGSITLLSGSDRAASRSMLQTIQSTNPNYRNIPIRLSPIGLSVWDSPME
jgi:D-glycero-alpha-D-manno-heptose-7-phosphate kinase